MGGYIPVIHGSPADRPDEDDTLRNAGIISRALCARGYDSDILEIDFDLTIIEKLAQKKPLAVFNLVEAIRGNGAHGHIVCAAMDHFGLAYTGAGATAYFQSCSKVLSKQVLQAGGLLAPHCWMGQAPPAGAGRVIIKSVSEHASFGMDQQSVIDASQAADEIARREQKFGGRFFAEEYVHGREFNIAVLETADGLRVLPMAEMTFDALPEGVLPIVDYAAKWDENSPSYHLTRRRFGVEQDEPALARRLQMMTLDCWRAADLAGYARVDFRVDDKGAPFILEFNTNPCLAPEAGFAAALREAGLSFEDGVEAIVLAALRRRGD